MERDKIIPVIAESFQKECNDFVEEVLETSDTPINYQDATLIWTFYKLAELQNQINQLKKD